MSHSSAPPLFGVTDSTGQNLSPLAYPNPQTPFSTLLNCLRSPEDPSPHTFLPGAIGSGLTGSVYAQQNGSSLPLSRTTPPNLDPAQFIWAVSSQLPQVEESSPYEEKPSSISTGPSPLGEAGTLRKGKAKETTADGGKLVKITWWRPHGATAIAPGLKKITLKVRVTDSAAAFKTSSPRAALSELDAAPQQIIDPSGMPSPPIMRHLLEVFFVHFGSQFPCLNKLELDNQVDAGTGSAFLFNAIAAIAARCVLSRAQITQERVPDVNSGSLRTRPLLSRIFSPTHMVIYSTIGRRCCLDRCWVCHLVRRSLPLSCSATSASPMVRLHFAVPRTGAG